MSNGVLVERARPVTRAEWQADLAHVNSITNEPLSNVLAPIGPAELFNIAYIEACQAFESLATDRADAGDEKALKVVELLEAFDEPETATSPPTSISELLGHAVVQDFLAENGSVEEHTQFLEQWNAIAAQKAHDLVISGIDSGYIPRHVEARLDDALHKTGVRLVHNLAAKAIGMVGFYENRSDFYGFKADLLKKPDLMDTVLHEVMHKLSGGSFWKQNASQPASRRKIGFAHELTDGQQVRTGHNEAWDQHVTACCLYGNFETIDPDKRENDDGTYKAERTILAAIIEGACGVIDIKNAIRAFFADSGPEADKSAMRRYILQGNSAYGRGWFKKLDRLMEVAAWMPVEKVLSYIHPPIMDENNIIIATGTIDTETLPTFSDYFQNMYDEQKTGSNYLSL